MKLARVLRAPWVAAQATSARWVIGSLLVADVIAALMVAGFGLDMPAVVVLLCGVGLLWVYVLPQMLWLTQAAHRLRLPGMRRDMNTCLAVYALASVGLPALLAAVTSGQPGVTAVLAVLTLCACFLYAILPWVVSVGMCFLPALLGQLPHALDLPAPHAPGFVHWAAPLAGAMALFALWRWWQLQRRENLAVRPLFRPLALGFNVTMIRQQYAQGGGTTVSHQLDPLQLIRQRPDWLQPVADIHRTGPAFPQRSLRVALGGSYLPQRWTARRLSLLMPSTITILCGVVAIIWGLTTPDSIKLNFIGTMGHALAFGIGVVVTLTAAIVPIGFMNYLQLLWCRPDAVLPLLALLPGMGPMERMKHLLLETMLARPLKILAALWIMAFGAGLFAQLTVPAMALLLSVPVLSAGWLVVAVTCHLGGCLRPAMRRVFEWISIPALLILGCLSAWLPATVPTAIPWLALAWLVWAMLVGGVGWHAWQAYRVAPHAFVWRTT
ncbi:MAG TPA: hypothetical protein VF269_01735 [Rhodanobacteraceae bacterium]